MNRSHAVSVGDSMLVTRGGDVMAKSKPSKSALSKAGKTLASNGSSKGAKSKAGGTLGKG